MRYTLFSLLAFLLFIFSQCKSADFGEQVVDPSPSLDTLWNVYEQYKKAERPESAVATLDSIMRISHQLKASPDYIMAAYFTYMSIIQKEGETRGIEYLLSLLEKNEGVKANLLHYLTGLAYFEYYDHNQWEINSRTTLTSEPKDVKTWGHEQFIKKIRAHLFQSVDTSLRNETLADWKLVLNKLDSSLVEYRPTLYDVIVPEVVQMLSSSNMQLLVLDEVKWLKDERLLDQKELFYKIEVKDSLSSLDESIKLFQNWLQWLETQDQNILSHADLSRLGYFYINTKHPQKDKLYIEALDRFIGEYSDTMAIAKAMHEKATLYYQMGEAIVGENLNGWQKAVMIAEQLNQMYPETPYAKDATNIKEYILSPHLSVLLEKVYLPGQPLLVNINVRNLSSLELEAYKVTPAQLETIQKTGYKEFPDLISKMKKSVSKEYALPVSENYTYKNYEIAFPSLSGGLFIIVARAKEGVYWQSIEVTDLAAFTLGGDQIMVVDRNTGEPVDQAEVIMTERDWRNPSKDSITMRTDGEGKIIVEESHRYSIEKVKKNSRIHYPGLSVYGTRKNSKSLRPRQIHLLTDRSIYRPGQNIFFKGILYKQIEDKDWKIIPNETLEIELIDQNGQVIAQKELTTNAWGSIEGDFRLPSEMLTGNVRLKTAYGSLSVKVEEYKRPGFTAKIDVQKGAQKVLGDSIRIEGLAETLNGVSLDKADVRYTVRRQYFIPWYYSYYRPVNEQQKEIASGQILTNKNGQFGFVFHAEADSSNQYARYQVLVEVTDRGGETQTAELSIYLSNKPYQVQTEIARLLDRSQAKEIDFKIVNNFDQPVSTKLTVTLSRLDGPESHKIERYWGFPDSILMSESDFRKQFEHYAFTDKERPDKWDRLGQEVNLSFSADSAFTLPESFWDQAHKGWHSLTFSSKEGEEVISYYFEIVSGKTQVSSQPQLSFINLPATMEVGQKKTVSFVKPFSSSKVYQWIAYSQRPHQKYWSDQTEIVLMPNELDRGGISLAMVSVTHNRIYTQNDWIQVPWTNKDLDIRVRTFRDELKPGEKEQWTFTVSDPEAELAATLYDASLDEIYEHNWKRINYPQIREYTGISHNSFYSTGMRTSIGIEHRYRELQLPEYPSLRFNRVEYRYRPILESDVSQAEYMSPSVQERANVSEGREADMQAMKESKAVEEEFAKKASTNIRNNLNETVFFQPIVHKDESGNYQIDFTMGEALTAWNLFLFAHTKNMKTGTKTLEVKTRKELMIKPLLPRFLRSGDTIQVVGRIQNQSGYKQNVDAELVLKNALTGKVVNDQFSLSQVTKTFQISEGETSVVGWRLIIPEAQEIPAVEVEMWAKSDKWVDGESNILALVSDRVIVQTALPLEVSSENKKEFDLKDWSQNILKSPTAKPLEYGLEFTKQPLWYAVQALPYLTDVEFECSERLVNQLYANALAQKIASEVPNLEAILRQWDQEGNLKSPLLKNEKWKSVDINQTPWLKNALAETQQMKKIELLLNDQLRNYKSQQIIEKLRSWQNADGGYSWFRGGPSNPYMSQYIAIQLQRMVDLELTGSETVSYILNSLIPYCDRSFEEWYDRIEKKLEEGEMQWGLTQVHYYYLKSSQGIIPDHDAWKYLDTSLKKHWMQAGLYEQALIARSWQLQGKSGDATSLLISFREKALKDPVIGAYWNQFGLRRTYTDDIELHAMMIEVFEAAGYQDFTDQLKTWLIKNKQTNHWNNSKSTAEAIHALLLRGKEELDQSGAVSITSGGDPVQWTSASAIEDFYLSYEKEASAFTGYPFSNISVNNLKSHPVWGAAYIQYSDKMDKIHTGNTEGLTIEKRYFVEKWGARGAELIPLEDHGDLKIGDVLVARIIVSVDRSMDFVHLKSERPSSMEPVSQISGFKYRDGLGYYESIKDLAAHYFIDHLPKGTFVFEHRERVVLKGNCLGGLIQIESMYAPEYRAHTSGTNIQTFEK